MAKRGRKINPELMVEVILEGPTEVESSGRARREGRLRTQQLPEWKAQFLENASQIFGAPSGQPAGDMARSADLGWLPGRRRLPSAAAWARFSTKFNKGKAVP